MRKSFISTFISLGLFISQVAFGNSIDLSKKIDILETEIDHMQKSISNIIDNDKISNNIKNRSKNINEDLIAEIKNIQINIEKLELEIKTISAQNLELEKKLNKKINSVTEQFNNEQAGDNMKNSYLISNIAKEIESNEQFYNDTSAEKNQDKAAAEYQKAYILLKQNNASPEIQKKAVEAFMNFIEKFQDSPLRGNAYYWIGSIHSQQRQYNKAAIDFLNGYKANIKSGRAIDNLLGLSDALIKLNRTKEACAGLNKLYNDFPNMNITNKRHADEMFNNASCLKDN